VGRAPAHVRALVEPELGEVLQAFAARILRRFRPDVVVGIARGGVFVGQALAAALGADFQPLRLAKRTRDPSATPSPLPALPDLHGRKVLVVDDMASSGLTLARARALSRKKGSRDVRTAVVVERRGSDARPDFAALRTHDQVVFAWDGPAARAGPGEAGA
jgi:hypoxanthine phosphoribosyltransferase